MYYSKRELVSIQIMMRTNIWGVVNLPRGKEGMKVKDALPITFCSVKDLDRIVPLGYTWT